MIPSNAPAIFTPRQCAAFILRALVVLLCGFVSLGALGVAAVAAPQMGAEASDGIAALILISGGAAALAARLACGGEA